jgi:hypothetical protein
MSAEVIVSFGADQDVRFAVEALMDSFEARAWLDGEFLALGCEPMRASGKVLVADKLLSVADAAGIDRFRDPIWGPAFARAAAGAAQRTMLRIDLPGHSVNY